DDAPPWDLDGPAGPTGPAGHAEAPASTPAQPEAPTSRRARIAEVAAQAHPDVPPPDPDAAVDLDDAEVDAESSAELLARELGARMIEEIPRT
ncbi:hypothetical protein JK386_13905, partial [Nocardioides sp. zg-536]|nr:hypothetical protein [Nocardioides faecalis]